MKFNVIAAAAAIALAIAATAATAGVVISEKVVENNQAAERKTDQTATVKVQKRKGIAQAGERKFDRTVMIQGHKQKVITGDREVITDLDAGKMYFVVPEKKQFIQIPFPVAGIVERIMMREGVSLVFTKNGKTGKGAGYPCDGYIGAATIGYANISMVQCVAKDAPGAKEYVEFQRTMAQKLKGTKLQSAGEVPDGIPVSSTITTTQLAFAVTGGIPAAQLAKMQEANAKHPSISSTNVSKIEVKDIPAEAFVVPADYNKQEMESPEVTSKLVRRGAPATAPGSSSKAGASVVPGAPSANAPH